MSDAFFCEYKDHAAADRRVRSRFDQYLLTVDIMTADNKRRDARMHPYGKKGGLRLCHDCVILIKGSGGRGEPVGQGMLDL